MQPAAPGLGISQVSRQMSSNMMNGMRMNQMMSQPINFDAELGSTNWQHQQSHDNFLNTNTHSNSSMMIKNYEPQLNAVTNNDTDQIVEDFLYD